MPLELGARLKYQNGDNIKYNLQNYGHNFCNFDNIYFENLWFTSKIHFSDSTFCLQ